MLDEDEATKLAALEAATIARANLVQRLKVLVGLMEREPETFRFKSPSPDGRTAIEGELTGVDPGDWPTVAEIEAVFAAWRTAKKEVERARLRKSAPRVESKQNVGLGRS